MAKGQHSVCFNEDQYQKWKKLYEDGKTVETFPDFVKSAFSDRVVETRVKFSNLDPELAVSAYHPEQKNPEQKNLAEADTQ